MSGTLGVWCLSVPYIGGPMDGQAYQITFQVRTVDGRRTFSASPPDWVFIPTRTTSPPFTSDSPTPDVCHVLVADLYRLEGNPVDGWWYQHHGQGAP